MAGCEFDPIAEVKAFAAYKNRLGVEHSDWSPEFLHKQALIVFNTEMYPLQVESYLAEKKGELSSSTGQVFQIVADHLVNEHYDFQNMIDYAASEEEKDTMVDFQKKAVAAKTGDKIYVLDLSALGKGGGIKYLDVYEKETDNLIRHKERIDLAVNQPDMILEEAENIVMQMELPMEPMQFRPLPEIMPMPVNAIPEIQFAGAEKPISVSGTSAEEKFKPEVAIEPVIVEMPQFVFVANKTTSGFGPEVPTRTDLVGQTVNLGVDKPVIIFETPIVKQEVINLDKSKPKEKPELFQVEKQQLKVTVVEDRRCFPEKRILEKAGTAAIVFESAAQQKEPIYEIQAARRGKGKVEMETKMEMEVEEKKQIKTAGNDKKFEIHDAIASKISNVSLPELPEDADEIKVCEARGLTEEEIPIYQHNWQPAAIKDIPEWVWQGTAAIPDEIIDWSWFLVTMFYALLNTKVLLKARES